MLVRDLMTTTLHSLAPGDTVADAKQLMTEKRIRHFPIVEDGVFVGLVTHRDVLRAGVSQFAEVDATTTKEIDQGIPLSELMNNEPVVIDPEAGVRDAVAVMLEYKFGCLPVVQNKRLVGILTEADFLKLVAELLDALDKAD